MKNRSASIAIIMLIGVATSSISATSQTPDKIWIGNIEYNLFCNPLEMYLTIHPDRRMHGDVRSSALWREYIATFRIDDNALYIVDVVVLKGNEKSNGEHETISESAFKKTFGSEKPCKYEEYSGLLVIPTGELVQYIHMGYASLYSNYKIVFMKNGKVLKEENLSDKEYLRLKRKQFAVYRNTPEYKKVFDEMAEVSSSADSDQEIDKFLFIFNEEFTRINPEEVN
jgi:hypothetical protein